MQGKSLPSPFGTDGSGTDDRTVMEPPLVDEGIEAGIGWNAGRILAPTRKDVAKLRPQDEPQGLRTVLGVDVELLAVNDFWQ
jgi:hypothetical protein